MRKSSKFIMVGSTLAALAVPALAPALASADVPRYQIEHATLTTTLPDQQYVHTYDVTINPCTRTFNGTGNGVTAYGWTFSNESIKGTLADGGVTFTATYLQDSPVYPGYQWGVTNASLDGKTQSTMWDTMDEQGIPTTSTLNVTSSTGYKNHGDYVSSVGGGADAAHSCIGMPINSAQG